MGGGTGAQTIIGDKNVVIRNVSGSYISIAIDGQASRPVPLEPAKVHLHQSAAAMPPSMLVRARYGIVPFLDHTGLAAKLWDWCTGPAPFALRTISGPGGTGNYAKP